MDDATRKTIDRRLARVEGQVAGLRRMVAENRYCVDVLTQLAAVRGALDELGAELVACHMRTCVLGHGTATGHPSCSGMTQEEMLEELRVALSRLLT
jgi:DNA-binding FrmR family transcriptional regulator